MEVEQISRLIFPWGTQLFLLRMIYGAIYPTSPLKNQLLEIILRSPFMFKFDRISQLVQNSIQSTDMLIDEMLSMSLYSSPIEARSSTLNLREEVFHLDTDRGYEIFKSLKRHIDFPLKTKTREQLLSITVFSSFEIQKNFLNRQTELHSTGYPSEIALKLCGVNTTTEQISNAYLSSHLFNGGSLTDSFERAADTSGVIRTGEGRIFVCQVLFGRIVDPEKQIRKAGFESKKTNFCSWSVTSNDQVLPTFMLTYRATENFQAKTPILPDEDIFL